MFSKTPVSVVKKKLSRFDGRLKKSYYKLNQVFKLCGCDSITKFVGQQRGVGCESFDKAAHARLESVINLHSFEQIAKLKICTCRTWLGNCTVGSSISVNFFYDCIEKEQNRQKRLCSDSL